MGWDDLQDEEKFARGVGKQVVKRYRASLAPNAEKQVGRRIQELRGLDAKRTFDGDTPELRKRIREARAELLEEAERAKRLSSGSKGVASLAKGIAKSPFAKGFLTATGTAVGLGTAGFVADELHDARDKRRLEQRLRELREAEHFDLKELEGDEKIFRLLKALRRAGRVTERTHIPKSFAKRGGVGRAAFRNTPDGAQGDAFADDLTDRLIRHDRRDKIKRGVAALGGAGVGAGAATLHHNRKEATEYDEKGGRGSGNWGHGGLHDVHGGSGEDEVSAAQILERRKAAGAPPPKEELAGQPVSAGDRRRKLQDRIRQKKDEVEGAAETAPDSRNILDELREQAQSQAQRSLPVNKRKAMANVVQTAVEYQRRQRYKKPTSQEKAEARQMNAVINDTAKRLGINRQDLDDIASDMREWEDSNLGISKFELEREKRRASAIARGKARNKKKWADRLNKIIDAPIEGAVSHLRSEARLAGSLATERGSDRVAEAISSHRDKRRKERASPEDRASVERQIDIDKAIRETQGRGFVDRSGLFRSSNIDRLTRDLEVESGEDPLLRMALNDPVTRKIILQKRATANRSLQQHEIFRVMKNANRSTSQADADDARHGGKPKAAPTDPRDIIDVDFTEKPPKDTAEAVTRFEQAKETAKDNRAAVRTSNTNERKLSSKLEKEGEDEMRKARFIAHQLDKNPKWGYNRAKQEWNGLRKSPTVRNRIADEVDVDDIGADTWNIVMSRTPDNELFAIQQNPKVTDTELDKIHTNTTNEQAKLFRAINEQRFKKATELREGGAPSIEVASAIQDVGVPKPKTEPAGPRERSVPKGALSQALSEMGVEHTPPKQGARRTKTDIRQSRTQNQTETIRNLSSDSEDLITRLRGQMTRGEISNEQFASSIDEHINTRIVPRMSEFGLEPNTAEGNTFVEDALGRTARRARARADNSGPFSPFQGSTRIGNPAQDESVLRFLQREVGNKPRSKVNLDDAVRQLLQHQEELENEVSRRQHTRIQEAGIPELRKEIRDSRRLIDKMIALRESAGLSEVDHQTLANLQNPRAQDPLPSKEDGKSLEEFKQKRKVEKRKKQLRTQYKELTA